MRIINQMPYSDCEDCKKCILSVKHSTTWDGEKVIYASCKNAKKCVRKKGSDNAEQK